MMKPTVAVLAIIFIACLSLVVATSRRAADTLPVAIFQLIARQYGVKLRVDQNLVWGLSMQSNKDMEGSVSESEVNGNALDTEAARRRMLMRLGVYGAVTAPILLGALTAEKAVAATPIGPGIPGGGGPGGVVF